MKALCPYPEKGEYKFSRAASLEMEAAFSVHQVRIQSSSANERLVGKKELIVFLGNDDFRGQPLMTVASLRREGVQWTCARIYPLSTCSASVYRLLMLLLLSPREPTVPIDRDPLERQAIERVFS